MCISGKNIIVPPTLKIRCKSAALWAVLFVPTVERIAVIHVPILHPNNIGNAPWISIAPVVARTINIAVVADELWRIAVIAAPAITPIAILLHSSCSFQ